MDLRKVVGSRPLIMVGASVILLDSSNRLLLQLRTDNNAWGLPGGSLEMGENLVEVAKRELYEETGLIANKLEFLNMFSGKEFYYKYPHGDEVYNVISTYICTDYIGDLKMDESEAKELCFFHLDRLPSTISLPDFPIITQFIEKFNLGK